MLNKAQQKELIQLAKDYHDNNELLDKEEGKMFLAVILNHKMVSEWSKSELKRWGYLLHPYYLSYDLFEEIGAIS